MSGRSQRPQLFFSYNLTLRPYGAPWRSRSLHAFGVMGSSGRLLGTHRHHTDRWRQDLPALGHVQGRPQKSAILTPRPRVVASASRRAFDLASRGSKSRGSRRGTPEHECSLCSSRRAEFESETRHTVSLRCHNVCFLKPPEALEFQDFWAQNCF